MNTDYRARVALSQSTAKLLLQSPAAARFRLDNPTDPTPAMVLGTRVHMAVLEPERFAATCIPGPDLSSVRTKDGAPAKNPAATTEGKALIAAYLAAHPGCDVLTDDEMRQVCAMRDALLCKVGSMVKSATCEQECFWRRDDADCKGKLDALGDDWCLDLKTYSGEWTADAMQRTALAHGWHMQAAWYTEAAAAAHGIDVQTFMFAVVSSREPYEVALLKCDDDFVAHGVEAMNRALAIWKQCMASGNWPDAQAQGLIGDTLTLPGWVARGRDVSELDAELARMGM